jgi:ppGpp synthetase/RelA/SpoT-type nucleotidyltranferase
MEGSQTIDLVRSVERCISSLGIMHRIFHREKTKESLSKKLQNSPGKYGEEKKIQDLIGIRIALYFVDDIAVVREALEKRFTYVQIDSQIDEPDSEVFKAVRCNLIFKLPDNFDFSTSLDSEHLELIDNTFEVQIRTILSEGWHEIDHDLRYKCKEDWHGLDRENRAFNGVYATLETSEWTLLKLFEELAYKHYKESNLKAMLNNKFRIRLRSSPLDDSILLYIGDKPELIKRIYRYSRTRMLQCFSARPYAMPLSIANLVFIMNLDSFNDAAITEMMPDKFRNWWESAE